MQGNARLSHDELNMILDEIGRTRNVRPLTLVSGELERDVPSPEHLLQGRNISSLSDCPVQEDSFWNIDLGDRNEHFTE